MAYPMGPAGLHPTCQRLCRDPLSRLVPGVSSPLACGTPPSGMGGLELPRSLPHQIHALSVKVLGWPASEGTPLLQPLPHPARTPASASPLPSCPRLKAALPNSQLSSSARSSHPRGRPRGSGRGLRLHSSAAGPIPGGPHMPEQPQEWIQEKQKGGRKHWTASRELAGWS